MNIQRRKRRTTDEMIRDLQAEIARLNDSKKAKSSPARKQARASLRGLEKALSMAEEENDSELTRALGKAIALIDGCFHGGGGARVRRTADDLEQLGLKIVEFVRSNAQSTVGAISDALNESSKELREPIAMLLENGSLQKEGQRRGTRYFVK